jgi:hypothetical protein
MVTATGYLNPRYAQSLIEYGIPRELPRCGGWILERQIPGSPYRDAMGCYPLFMCQDWSQLAHDLQNLEDGLITLAMVADPFCTCDEPSLHRIFDVVIAFKKHYVADLQRPIDEIVSRHHRRYARKALENVQVEICEEPIRYIDEWTALYASLSERHNVNGLRAFSRIAFLKQLSIPGLVMFRATYRGTAVGTAIVVIQQDVAYGHLIGFNEVGHELGVSYALYYSHFGYLFDKVRWIDWGGTSGVQNNALDGLSQFKRGWSTDTRIAYFCGKVLDQARYAALVEEKTISETTYFPAYRSDERL